MAAVEMVLRTILWAVPAFTAGGSGKDFWPTWVTMAK